MTSRNATRFRAAVVGVVAAALVAAAAGPALATSRNPGGAVVAAGATGFASEVDGRTYTQGVADRATGRRIEAGDEFQIGSNTKTFTATVMLQLVGEGRLRLDDPISRWYPAIPDADRITVRMLLQHTSGIADYLGDDSVGEKVLAGDPYHWTPEELVAIGVALAPYFEPGAAWAYSNTNYVLAGMIMRKVTGLSPAQLITRRIIEPLGLRHTYWAPDARFHGRHMHGYYRTEPGGSQYVDITDAPLYWADAAGAMVSTLSDLARFERALQGGHLLEPAQLKQMRATVDMPAPEGLTAGYGLGLARLDTRCGTFWGHTGGSVGYLTQAWATADGRHAFTQVVPTGADTPVGADKAIEDAAQAAAVDGLCHL